VRLLVRAGQTVLKTLDIKALLESKMKMRMMTDITFVVFKATPM